MISVGDQVTCVGTRDLEFTGIDLGESYVTKELYHNGEHIKVEGHDYWMHIGNFELSTPKSMYGTKPGWY